jgi:GPH family glycoside/pentoside/hexuronide:cation symporter
LSSGGESAAASGRLTVGRKVNLAVGDLGLNLYWASINFFLLYFYTDILGIDTAVAGTIYMAASIFDGCIDPVMGMMMDRTRTRWGRYRPWIAIGAVPLALSFAALYWKPPLTGSALIALVVCVHLLFRVGYTSVAVPMASLHARLTKDSRERSSLTGYRALCAVSGTMMVAFFTQPLDQALSSEAGGGFFWVAVISGILATLIFLCVAISVKEPPEVETEVSAPAISSRASMRAAASNTAFCCLVLGLLGASLTATIVSKSLVYYFKYVVADEVAGRTALSIMSFSAFPAVPVWAMMAQRVGKRALWLTGVAIALTALTIFLLTRPTDATGATIFFVALQVSMAAIMVAYWAMLPDTVEYGEWITGIRLESFLVGLFMFCQKLGLGLAAGLFGWTLSYAGISHATGDAAAMRTALPLIIVLLAGTGLVASGAAIFFSPLRKGVHERICGELGRR